jgi:hypothetical protein
MEAKVVAPTEQDSVAETTALHVANITIGWFSYTLVNQVAISRISLAGVPGQALVINGMNGHILTPRQVALVQILQRSTPWHIGFPEKGSPDH